MIIVCNAEDLVRFQNTVYRGQFTWGCCRSYKAIVVGSIPTAPTAMRVWPAGAAAGLISRTWLVRFQHPLPDHSSAVEHSADNRESGVRFSVVGYLAIIV